MLIGDQLNVYYYYQHFHRRPVVAGFVTNNTFAPIEPGRDFVYGNWSIDSVLGAMPEQFRKKSSWHTMVDINDIDLLRSQFKGWVLIIHGDPVSEILRYDCTEQHMSHLMVNVMANAFGNPKFTDEHIAVWKIE